MSGDPNIGFTIIKEVVHEVARKAVRLGKQIRSSLVHMPESAVARPDPETAIAIPEQPIGPEPRSEAWERIRLNFAVNKLSDAARHGDYECTIVALDQSANFGLRPRIELRRPRLPSPQPGL